MDQQQFESNRVKNWYPNTIFNHTSHNYAVVVMGRPIYWEPEKVCEIWKKAPLTVTVNGGTYSWVQYLEKAGIDIFSGQYNELVPKVIITRRMDGRVRGAPPTVIEKLETLGSKVICVNRQSRREFTKALNRIVDYAYGMNMKLTEMYVLAESQSDLDSIQIVETLRISDGNIRNIEVIIVTETYFAWMLRRGVHKIHVTLDTLDEETPTIPTCNFLPLNSCEVNSLTTTGLQTNFTNISATEIDLDSSLFIPCSENVVTVDTDASISLFFNFKEKEEEIYDESDDESDDESLDE